MTTSPTDAARKARRDNRRRIKLAAARAAGVRAEARAEEIAPAVQRHGTTHLTVDPDTGKPIVATYSAPRLAPDGVSFKRSCPIWHLQARGGVTRAQAEAADRLSRSWEDGGRGVGLGASSYGERGSGMPQTGYISDVTLSRLDYQIRQQVEYEGACAWMGSLMLPLRAVVLDGIDVSAWGARAGHNPAVAKGYLLAALDRLLAYYVAIRPVVAELEAPPIRAVVVVARQPLDAD